MDKVKQYLTNVWIAGFAGGVVVALVFAVIGIFTPNGTVEAIGVTNHNVLRGISLVVIIPAVSLSMGYFTVRPHGWRSQWKLIIIAGACYVLASFLLGAVEISRMGSSESALYSEFYTGQTVLGLILLPILAVPAANGNWRVYLMLVFLPVLIAWFFIRIALRFSGGSGGSTGWSGGMSPEDRQRLQYEQIERERRNG